MTKQTTDSVSVIKDQEGDFIEGIIEGDIETLDIFTTRTKRNGYMLKVEKWVMLNDKIYSVYNIGSNKLGIARTLEEAVTSTEKEVFNHFNIKNASTQEDDDFLQLQFDVLRKYR